MSLVPTIGAVMIGDLVSVALYGLTTHQVYVYLQRSWTKDPWKLKAFIVYIWLLETVHTFLISSFLFRSVIIEFGNPAALLVTQVSDDVTTLITGLIIFSVHLFYIRRLWILGTGGSFRWLLCGVVTALAVCHLALETVVMVLTFKFPQFSEFHRITAYYTGSLAVAAACDMIIAGSMWYLLTSRRTGVKRLVNRILTFTITTGALTSVVDIAILICFVAMPDNLIYLSMYNLVNNLYANSLIAMINARESLGKISAGANTSIALSNVMRTGSDNTVSPSRGNGSNSQELSKVRRSEIEVFQTQGAT
ncbi:hypothetical protein C8Q76DRAFT_332285 [Earliella scabrosa]|nr:hypothetical protein C8Q76DRAFT_332285 [Earliella scabrosa]